MTLKNRPPHAIENRGTRNPGNQESFAFRLNYALQLRKLLAIDITNQTGIGKSTMSLYMNGKSIPSRERLIILAKALRVNAAWLFGLTPLEAYNRYDVTDPYLDKDLEQIRNIFNNLNKEGRKYLLNTATLLFESKMYNQN